MKFTLKLLFCSLSLAALTFAQKSLAKQSAGGRWIRTNEIDSLTDKKITGFEVTGVSASKSHARLSLICSGKLERLLVNVDIMLADDQITAGRSASQLVFVRFDEEKPYSATWRVLSTGKGLIEMGTAASREVLTGNRAKLRLRLHSPGDDQETYTFYIGGLDRQQVHEACAGR